MAIWLLHLVTFGRYSLIPGRRFRLFGCFCLPSMKLRGILGQRGPKLISWQIKMCLALESVSHPFKLLILDQLCLPVTKLCKRIKVSSCDLRLFSREASWICFINQKPFIFCAWVHEDVYASQPKVCGWALNEKYELAPRFTVSVTFFIHIFVAKQAQH